MATILRYHIKAGRTGFLSAPLLSIRRIHRAPVGGTLLPNLVHIELGHDQAVIDALFPHQLVVGSHLGDAVLVDDDDPVCFPEGGKPVGDGKGGPPFDQATQRLLDLVLGLGVQAAGGFVQDQQPRIMQDGPCNGDPLPFPARQGVALLPYIGVVASGSLVMNSCALAILAASITRRSSASGLA